MMSVGEDEDKTVYKVLVNHEEQYSIWPAEKENPLGWRDTGTQGPRRDCLAYIKDMWTDMRPLSLRQHMDEIAPRQAEPPTAEPSPTLREVPERDELVNCLSKGNHPVEASLLPHRTGQALKENIDSGYVHIKFTHTGGGTELRVKLDVQALDLSQADFNAETGRVHLEGGLLLNYVPVRCIADIDLRTFSGMGHLALESSL